ncbi:hypothetical protein KJF94_07105 [Pseudomonas hormoni]|uniref:XRE family transcriptional regulator n=1 Tax=Pseudomonas hormoni TaxID=3093767 RepID=A0ABX8F042_9PSED|nr:hypothetical protein [Pseudomonas hormoni]QVW25334.1 hypothetical protein KJF94_07105 [Pseudomonas hormoni]
MDISEIRRANLQTLMNDRFGGTKARIADELGKSPSYIARCLSLTIAPENRKKIGEDFARHIETVLGLDRYSMDVPLKKSGDRAVVAKAKALDLVASPRSQSALAKIVAAAESGRLTEEDMVLLERIAAKIAGSTPAASGNSNSRLRDRLKINDSGTEQ